MTDQELIHKIILMTMEGDAKWSVMDRLYVGNEIKLLDKKINSLLDNPLRTRSLVRQRIFLRTKIKQGFRIENSNIFGIKIRSGIRKRAGFGEADELQIRVSISAHEVTANIIRGGTYIDARYNSEHIPELVTLSFILRDPRNTMKEDGKMGNGCYIKEAFTRRGLRGN